MQPLFTDPPLATWRPFNHLGALRQIFLLYRKPKTFAAQLSNCPAQTTTALTLMLHALPWLIGAITLGRLLWQTPDLSILPALGGTALGLAVGGTWALGLGFNRGRHNLLTLAIPGMLTMGFIGGIAGYHRRLNKPNPGRRAAGLLFSTLQINSATFNFFHATHDKQRNQAPHPQVRFRENLYQLLPQTSSLGP